MTRLLHRSLRTGLAVLFAGSMLSGCMMAGNDYQRPDLGLPPVQAVAVPQSTATSIANVAWFDLYGDPQLQQLVREALADNLNLQMALARVEEAQGQMRVARSALFPALSGSRGTTASPQANSNDSNFSLGLIFNWQIDLFGRLRRMSEASRANWLASEAGRNAVVSQLVTQVATTWFTIRELRREELIVRSNIEIQSNSLKLVQALHRQGVVSDAEEQQAVSQLASTEASLPQLIQSRLVQENILAMLVGGYPEAKPDAAPAGAAGLIYQSLPLGVPSDLLARRPDVIAAEEQLHAATALKGAAMANRFPFPTIGLTALFGRSSSELGNLFSSGSSVALNSWGPTAALPILNFGRDAGNVDIASAQAKQALIGYRMTVQNALFEVNQAAYSLNAAQEQIAPLERQSASAQRLLALQQMRFRAGVSSYLELLDAQRQLLGTQLGVSRAQLSRDLAVLSLYQAVGGGWSDEGVAKAEPTTGQ
ncbi:MAG: efflux transporter outer membrane subunit [Proteobacteria bacterium]|nr:efflux transporter outer membrane subunit [Pseudomonadota bacterium]